MFDLTTLSNLILVRHRNQLGNQMLRLYIPNMTCGGCAKSVSWALLSVDPQARIETDPPAREVRVNSDLEESAFLASLSEAGYPAKP